MQKCFRIRSAVFEALRVSGGEACGRCWCEKAAGKVLGILKCFKSFIRNLLVFSSSISLDHTKNTRLHMYLFPPIIFTHESVLVILKNFLLIIYIKDSAEQNDHRKQGKQEGVNRPARGNLSVKPNYHSYR